MGIEISKNNKVAVISDGIDIQFSNIGLIALHKVSIL